MNNENTRSYKFEHAYAIRGQGVGNLDMDKAVKSQEFIDKLKEVAQSIKNAQSAHIITTPTVSR